MLSALGPMTVSFAQEQDEGAKLIDEMFPELKKARDFADALDQKFGPMLRWMGVLNDPAPPETGDKAPPPNELGGGLGVPVASDPPDPKEVERRQRELRAQMEAAQSERRAVASSIEVKLRVYISSSIDRCKRFIEAKDRVAARAACGVAQTKIAECPMVENQIEADLKRLTTRYRPWFGRAGDFSSHSVSCVYALRDLEDPARLLERASFQLPDSACDAHIARLREFTRTGTIRSVLGADDSSVPSYLSWIRKNCSAAKGDEAGRAVDQEKAAAVARAQPEGSEKGSKTENEMSSAITPERPRSALEAAFEDAIEEADIAEKKRREEREAAQRLAAERAETERRARAAEAARLAEEAEERRRAEFAFHQGLKTLGPGALFTLGDEREASGDSAQARAAWRALVSRFPNHPLAAAAAQRLGPTSGSRPANASSGRASVASSKAKSNYSSVCIRNFEKIQQIQNSSQVTFVPVSGTFEIENANYIIRLMTPCAESDDMARSWIRFARNSIERVTDYCNARRGGCSRFGKSEEEKKNSEFTQVFQAAAQAAIADPNWSSDLDGGPVASVGGTAVSSDSGVCEKGLAAANREVDAINRRRPANPGVIPDFQTLMYVLQLVEKHLQAHCIGRPEAGQLNDLRTRFVETMMACSKMATTNQMCRPKLNW